MNSGCANRMLLLAGLSCLAILAVAPAEDAKAPTAEAPARVVTKVPGSQGPDGLPIELTGLYWAPKARLAPGILLLHHLGHSAWVFDDLARRLHQEGYAVLAMNLRGHPESEVRKSGGMSWMRFEMTDFQAMVKDVDAARACLAGQREVDPLRLGLIGEQFGAPLALAGGTSEAFRTAVLLSPPMNERTLKTPESLTAFGERPCLAVASADDPEAEKVLEALKTAAKGRFETVLQPADPSENDFGAGMLSDESKKELGERILAFLRETLPPAAEPKP